MRIKVVSILAFVAISALGMPALYGVLSHLSGSAPLPDVVTTNLVFWKDPSFGNGSSLPSAGCGYTSYVDLITSAFNGTISNCSTGWQASPGSLFFDSSVSTSGTYVTGTFTGDLSGNVWIQMWLDPASFSVQPNARFIDITDASGNNIQIVRDSIGGYWVTKDTVYETGTSGTRFLTVVATGTWVSITAAFNTSTQVDSFWINDTPETAYSYNSVGAASTTSKFYLGARNDLFQTCFYDGAMGPVLVYTASQPTLGNIQQNCGVYPAYGNPCN